MKANVAVQRKLLVLIYTLWKKNERFDENYHRQLLREQDELASQRKVAPI